jgi:hypothetical protein
MISNRAMLDQTEAVHALIALLANTRKLRDRRSVTAVGLANIQARSEQPLPWHAWPVQKTLCPLMEVIKLRTVFAKQVSVCAWTRKSIFVIMRISS